jgi:hypothetical protein
VRRCGVDTVLICDTCNDRIVEISVSGHFIRHIAVDARGLPYGIAYNSDSNAIAVSLTRQVAVLRYDTGEVITCIEIARSFGLRFTANGAHILLTNYGNSCVSKYDAASGAPVCHIHNIDEPNDAVELEDGSIVVTTSGGVTYVGVDGVTTTSIVDGSFESLSLCYSPALNGVCVNEEDGGGRVVLFSDVWYSSLRCAWVSACVASWQCNCNCIGPSTTMKHFNSLLGRPEQHEAERRARPK